MWKWKEIEGSRMSIKFQHKIAGTLLLVLTLLANHVQAKTADIAELTTKLQNKQQQKNLNPKLAAREMLETIDKIYVTLPPGSLTKEIQGQLWFLKGQSYTTLHQSEDAIKAFDESIKYEPNNLNSYSNISYILNQQAKYGESIKISDWIISKNTLFTNAYLNKGYSLLGLLKYQEAIDNFEKARELDSDNITVYLGYAKGYAGLKQHDKAIEIYDGIIKYFGKEGKNSPQLKVLDQLRKEQINLKNKEGLSLVNNKKSKK
jgi:tetratricopeptide (TPR) repeat protein